MHSFTHTAERIFSAFHKQLERLLTRVAAFCFHALVFSKRYNSRLLLSP
jgi:hypothetical protein